MSGTRLAALAVPLALMAALALLARPRRASALDFYLAGRGIGTVTNALAICGDYFSAASFLGVAAAVYVSGLDGVWYATGFAAGFVPVALLVSAPLRRLGHVSLPDFLRRRFTSPVVGVVAVAVVQVVVFAYLVPQAVASGITFELLVDRGLPGMTPYATGVLASGVLMAALVVIGGMRVTTWTQAVQFLFLLVVLAWLAALVIGAGFRYASALGDLAGRPLQVAVVTDGGGWQLDTVANRLRGGVAQFSLPGARYGSLSKVALLVTLVLGTAGLPHVMNRYFTSPTGRATRATTVWVLAGAGAFYSLAVMLGTAARPLVSEAAAATPWLRPLTVDGVLRIPEHAVLVIGRLVGGTPGFAVLCVAALVAVMSTMAGLLLASAASFGHDVYQRLLRPSATPVQALRAARITVVSVTLGASALALLLEPSVITGQAGSVVATMVTWAFALAGSAITPVLVLSIWSRHITPAGAVAGMACGAGTTILAIGLGFAAQGELALVLGTPTPIAATVAAAVCLVVSRRGARPTDVDGVWLLLHGTAADRTTERLARLTVDGIGDDLAAVRSRGALG